MTWDTIEQRLHTLEESEQGYSSAHRGIIRLDDNNRIFVKIGVDINTKEWAKKEVGVYKFLADHSFVHIPKFIANNKDASGFALEALESKDSWNWTNEWTNARLKATLNAMDELANILPSETEVAVFSGKGLSRTANGWKPLLESDAKQAILGSKLKSIGYLDTINTTTIQAMAEESIHYIFKDDALVHNDVRADNCAWNPRTQSVKLIDWNWAQVGDRRIDINAMLVNIFKSGFNVTKDFTDRLDADALQWIAGFWLHASTMPLPAEGPEHSGLRDYQLESGITALKLRQKILFKS